jgi:hypothetical protein
VNDLGKDYELVQVERQVVAGFNYRFRIKSSELGLVEVIIYKDLNGEFDLINVSPVKEESKEL